MCILCAQTHDTRNTRSVFLQYFIHIRIGKWLHQMGPFLARRAIHSMGENEKSTSWENREEKYNKHSMSRTKGKKATNGGV